MGSDLSLAWSRHHGQAREYEGLAGKSHVQQLSVTLWWMFFALCKEESISATWTFSWRKRKAVREFELSLPLESASLSGYELQVFISKIRNCKNKEEEKSTVDKEMGKIRKKFTSSNVVTGE